MYDITSKLTPALILAVYQSMVCHGDATAWQEMTNEAFQSSHAGEAVLVDLIRWLTNSIQDGMDPRRAATGFTLGAAASFFQIGLIVAINLLEPSQRPDLSLPAWFGPPVTQSDIDEAERLLKSSAENSSHPPSPDSVQ